MTWTEAWSGCLTHPLDPKLEEVRLEDIAQGLSNKCRYNGQSRFYSVAEHSVHMADWCLREAPRESRKLTALHALLHDAAEAYLPDVSTPIKALFPKFRKYEDKFHAVILEAFHVPPICPQGAKLIKGIDKRIILNERDVVMPNHRPGTKWIVDDLEPLDGVEIYRWPPDEAYNNFIAVYQELTTTGGNCDHPWGDRQVSGKEVVCASCGKRWPIAGA